VFALPPVGEAGRVADALRAFATRAGMASEVFVVPVARQGLRREP
jgi:hypothetical protein